MNGTEAKAIAVDTLEEWWPKYVTSDDDGQQWKRETVRYSEEAGVWTVRLTNQDTDETKTFSIVVNVIPLEDLT